MMGSVHAVWVFGAIALISVATAYLFQSQALRSALAYVTIAASTAAMAFMLHAGAWAAVEKARQVPTEVVEESAIQDCAECPRLIRIPGGTLEYKHEDGRIEAYKIWPGFLMAEKPVSRRAYAAFVSATGHPYRDCKGREEPEAAETCVSKADVEAYALWLTRKTALQYRLPNDLQWRHAAAMAINSRAGLDISHAAPELVNDCNEACIPAANVSDGRPFRLMRRLSLSLN